MPAVISAAVLILSDSKHAAKAFSIQAPHGPAKPVSQGDTVFFHRKALRAVPFPAGHCSLWNHAPSRA